MPGGCDDEGRKLATGCAEKGQFILLDAGFPHKLLVQDGVPCRMLNVEFGFVRLAPGQPSIRQLALEEEELHTLLTCAAPYLVLPDPEDVYHTMKSLVLELDQRGLMEQRQERRERKQGQGPPQGWEASEASEASGSEAVRMGVIPAEERTIHREARNLTSRSRERWSARYLCNCSFGSPDCEERWNGAHWIIQSCM